MGDLNMMPTSFNYLRIKEVLTNVVPEEYLTYPSNKLFDRRDYIFVSKDILYKDAKVVNIIFSDHLPLIATII